MNVTRAAVRHEQEPDLTYTDKSTGREITFAPKTDEVMVTFRGEASTDALNGVIEDTRLASVSAGYDLERGFAAVTVAPDTGLDAATRSLDDSPDIANTLPVMLDEHGASRYFLPDEFTVQFAADVDAARAEQIIADHGSGVVVAQRTPGYYSVAMPEGRGLFEMIREFSELAEVSFAEPSEVSFNSALAYIPDDPDFGRLWGLRNTGQSVNGTTGTAGADIRVTDAWDVVRGDPDVVVPQAGARGHPSLGQ